MANDSNKGGSKSPMIFPQKSNVALNWGDANAQITQPQSYAEHEKEVRQKQKESLERARQKREAQARQANVPAMMVKPYDYTEGIAEQIEQAEDSPYTSYEAQSMAQQVNAAKPQEQTQEVSNEQGVEVVAMPNDYVKSLENQTAWGQWRGTDEGKQAELNTDAFNTAANLAYGMAKEDADEWRDDQMSQSGVRQQQMMSNGITGMDLAVNRINFGNDYYSRLTPSAVNQRIDAAIQAPDFQQKIAASLEQYRKTNPNGDEQAYVKNVIVPGIQRTIYNKYVQSNVPKNTLEYLMTTAVRESLTGKILDMAFATKEQREAWDEATRRYKDQRDRGASGALKNLANSAEDAAAMGLAFATDAPLFELGGAVAGGLYGGGTRVAAGLGKAAFGKAGLKGVARLAGNRWMQAAGQGALNMGLYSGASGTVETINSHDNPKSAEEAWKNLGEDLTAGIKGFAEGAITGAAMGLAGRYIDKLTGKLWKSWNWNGGRDYTVPLTGATVNAKSSAISATNTVSKLLGQSSVMTVADVAGRMAFGDYKRNPDDDFMSQLDNINWLEEFDSKMMMNAVLMGKDATKGALGSVTAREPIRFTNEEVRAMESAGMPVHTSQQALDYLRGAGQDMQMVRVFAHQNQQMDVPVPSRVFEAMNNKQLSRDVRNKICAAVGAPMEAETPVSDMSATQRADGTWQVTESDVNGRTVRHTNFNTENEAKAYIAEGRNQCEAARQNKLSEADAARRKITAVSMAARFYSEDKDSPEGTMGDYISAWLKGSAKEGKGLSEREADMYDRMKVMVEGLEPIVTTRRTEALENIAERYGVEKEDVESIVNKPSGNRTQEEQQIETDFEKEWKRKLGSEYNEATTTDEYLDRRYAGLLDNRERFDAEQAGRELYVTGDREAMRQQVVRTELAHERAKQQGTEGAMREYLIEKAKTDAMRQEMQKADEGARQTAEDVVAELAPKNGVVTLVKENGSTDGTQEGKTYVVVNELGGQAMAIPVTLKEDGSVDWQSVDTSLARVRKIAKGAERTEINTEDIIRELMPEETANRDYIESGEEPKDGMLLKDKDGQVWRVRSTADNNGWYLTNETTGEMRIGDRQEVKSMINDAEREAMRTEYANRMVEEARKGQTVLQPKETVQTPFRPVELQLSSEDGKTPKRVMTVEEMPKDEQGNVLWHRMSVSDTVAYLKENLGEEDMLSTLRNRISRLQSDLDSEQRNGEKIDDPIQKQESRARIVDLQSQLKHWQDVQKVVEGERSLAVSDRLVNPFSKNKGESGDIELMHKLSDSLASNVQIVSDEEFLDAMRREEPEREHSMDEVAVTNGFMSKDGKRIYVKRSSIRGVTWTFGHETLHRVAQLSKGIVKDAQGKDIEVHGKEYQELVSAILNALGKDRVADLMKIKRSLGNNMTDELALEEIAGDSVGEVFSNKDMLKKVVNRLSTKGLGDMWQNAKDWVEKKWLEIDSKLTNDEERKQANEQKRQMIEMTRIIGDAYKAAAEKEQSETHKGVAKEVEAVTPEQIDDTTADEQGKSKRKRTQRRYRATRKWKDGEWIQAFQTNDGVWIAPGAIKAGFDEKHQLLQAIQDKYSDYCVIESETEDPDGGFFIEFHDWNLPKPVEHRPGTKAYEKALKHEQTLRGRIDNRASEIADKLNIRLVVHHRGKGLTAKQKKSRGWYDVDKRTVHVNADMALSLYDLQATILHEAIAHHGLRELIGNDRMEGFLQAVVDKANDQMGMEIARIAKDNHISQTAAAEEYLGMIAEDMGSYIHEGEVGTGRYATQHLNGYKAVWENIKELLTAVLKDLGFAIRDKKELLTDDELRFILQKSYANLKAKKGLPGSYKAEREARDREYMEAVEGGDMEAARNMLDEKLRERMAGGEIVPFIAVESYQKGRELAHGIKDGDTELTREAAVRMANLVPEGALLVPMPGHTGQATTTLDLTKMIANACKEDGKHVAFADGLYGKERQSQYTAKQEGRSLTADEMGMESLLNPLGVLGYSKVFIVDNVVATGTTAKAAVDAMRKTGVDATVLALAYSGNTKDIPGLKNVEAVTRDAQGNVIPLSERLNEKVRDVMFSKEPTKEERETVIRPLVDGKTDKGMPKVWDWEHEKTMMMDNDEYIGSPDIIASAMWHCQLKGKEVNDKNLIAEIRNYNNRLERKYNRLFDAMDTPYEDFRADLDNTMSLIRSTQEDCDNLIDEIKENPGKYTLEDLTGKKEEKPAEVDSAPAKEQKSAEVGRDEIAIKVNGETVGVWNEGKQLETGREDYTPSVEDVIANAIYNLYKNGKANSEDAKYKVNRRNLERRLITEGKRYARVLDSMTSQMYGAGTEVGQWQRELRAQVKNKLSVYNNALKDVRSGKNYTYGLNGNNDIYFSKEASVDDKTATLNNKSIIRSDESQEKDVYLRQKAQFLTAEAKKKSEEAHPDYKRREIAYLSDASRAGIKFTYEELEAIPEIQVAQSKVDANKKNRLKITNVERRIHAAHLLDKDHGSYSGQIEVWDEESGKLKKKDIYKGNVEQGRKAFFIIGRPAGGKSSVYANPLSEANRARIIDSDVVKPWLEGFDNGDGAGYVQNASADIADKALEIAAERGDNVVIPKIGGKTILKQALELRLKGYDVQLYYNDVPAEVSMTRSMARFAETGRFLDLKYLDGIDKKNPNPTEIFRIANGSVYDIAKYLAEDERKNNEAQKKNETFYQDILKQLDYGRQRSTEHSGSEGAAEGRGVAQGDEQFNERAAGGYGQNSETYAQREGAGKGNKQYASSRRKVSVNDESLFSYTEWKNNDVKFGEKPKMVWNSKSGEPIATAGIEGGDVTKGRNFKKWFGDWEKNPGTASKVVDEDGKPLVLAHGTPYYGFTVFDTRRNRAGEITMGSHFGSREAAEDRLSTKNTGNNQGIYNVYLNIKNPWECSDWFDMNDPFVMTDLAMLALKHKNNAKVQDMWRIIRRLESWSQKYTDEQLADGDQLDRHSLESYDEDDMGTLHNFVKAMVEAAGHDGIKYWNDAEGHGYSWVAFRPEQIKSADTTGRMANNGNYSESKDIRFSKEAAGEEENPVWRSNAGEALRKLKMDKAPAEQWLAMLKKEGGIKAGEDKWMRLSQWLQEQTARAGVGLRDKNVTKQEIAEYIAQNQIEVKEVRYDENGIRSESDIDDFYSELPPAVDKFNTEMVNEFDELVDGGMSFDEAYEAMAKKYGEGFREAYDKDEQDGDYLQWTYMDPLLELAGVKNKGKETIDRAINPTRLQYTTEGLKNKKEIALVVPTIEPYHGNLSDLHFGGEETGGKTVAWARFGDAIDGDGNRVLMIDEIQSQRHQDGREKGYRDDTAEKARQEKSEKVKELQNERFEYHKKLIEKYGDKPIEDLLKQTTKEERFEWYRIDGAWQDAFSELLHMPNAGQAAGVPDAPFDKNWQELAMKRMLRYAAENGYDKLVWTDGATQTERYGISKHIDVIEIKKKSVGNGYQVKVKGTDGEGNIIDKAYADETELSHDLGKELAHNLIEKADAEPNSIVEVQGDGLKVGGEGMKGFYDQMLPRFMDKYGKKWGVKTYDMHLDGLKDASSDYQVDGGLNVHAVDITPEMKEDVMQGQVMFSKESVADAKLEESHIQYSKEERKDVLDELEKGKTVKVYRAVRIGDDGKIYSPMAGGGVGGQRKTDRVLTYNPAFGEWEKADEHPELAIYNDGDEYGHVYIDKGEGNGSLKVAYNPYIHASYQMLNDQFSSAWHRPNLAVMEVEVPVSELTSGYKADKAKNSVGETQWTDGVVARQLPEGKKRTVVLSRWDKPMRIVPVEEYAKAVAEQLDGTDVKGIPFNTVTPEQRDALVKAGVNIIEPEKKAGEDAMKAYEEWKNGGGEPDGGVRFSQEKEEERRKSDLESIRKAIAVTDTNPTEAQKKSGNYKMGHAHLDGYELTIENPAGSVRRGTDPDGKKWETKMHYTYGYIKGTRGVDGDHIDIFLSENPTEGKVYVVDQVDPKTGKFDEHKVMYGFNSEEEAKEAYLLNYEEGWQGLGNITEVSKDVFKKWIESSVRKIKPFSEYKRVATESLKFSQEPNNPEWKETMRMVKGKDSEAERMLRELEPRTVEEVASQVLAGGGLLWEDYDDNGKVLKGVKSMMGWKEGERRNFMNLFKKREDGGVSLEKAGEAVIQACREWNIPIDESDAMVGVNALQDVLGSVRTAGELTHYIENERVQQVRDMLEENERRAAEDRDEWYQEQYGMTYEDYQKMRQQQDKENQGSDENDKKQIDWLKARNERQAEQLRKIGEELQQLKIDAVSQAAYQSVVGQKDLSEQQRKELEAELKEQRTQMGTLKGNQTRYAKAYRQMREVREKLVNYIREQLASEDMPYISKSELNSLLRRLQTTNRVEDLESAYVDVQNVTNKGRVRHLESRLERLMDLKIQGFNGKRMSVAKTVDDSTRRIIMGIRSHVGDMELTGLEEQMDALVRERREKRGEINELQGMLKEETNAARRTFIQRDIDEKEAEWQSLSEQIDKKADEIDDIRSSKRKNSKVDVKQDIQELEEKAEQAAEGTEKWTEEDAERLTALRAVEIINEGKEADSNVRKLNRDISAKIDELTEMRNQKRDPLDIQQVQEDIDRMKSLKAEALKAQGDAVQKAVDTLNDLMDKGRNNLKEQVDADIMHSIQVRRGAFSDLKGGRTLDLENPADKADKNPTVWNKATTEPLYSFEWLCKSLNRRGYGTDSYLYRYFIKGKNGVMEAYNTQQRGLYEDMEQLNRKVTEIFGTKNGKVFGTDAWVKQAAKADEVVEHSGVSRVGEDGRRYEIPMSKGQAAYVYAVNKMSDGHDALFLHGWDNQSMKEIEDFIGPEYKELVDWLQKDFLTATRAKYNERYKEMYHTSMARIDNYVPLRRDPRVAGRTQSAITGDNKSAMRQQIEERAKALITRTVNTLPIDYTQSIFDVITNHIKEQETWYAYAPVRRDLAYLLDSKFFKNTLNAQHPGAFKRFEDSAFIVTQSDQSMEAGHMDDILGKFNKLVVGQNIAWRFATALKQLYSAPAYLGYAENPEYWMYLTKNCATGLLGRNWQWSRDNIPSFRRRVDTGDLGDYRLSEDNGEGRVAQAIQKYLSMGMKPNRIVDGVTCSIGTKAIYDYNMAKAKREIERTRFETPEEKQKALTEARRVALMEADIFYNATQQSSHPAFLSDMQKSRSLLDRCFTAYQNSNIGYTRDMLSAARDLLTSAKYEDTLQYYTERYQEEQGLDEEDAKNAAQQHILKMTGGSIARLCVFGWLLKKLWNMGSTGFFGFLTGDDDEKKKKDDETESEYKTRMTNLKAKEVGGVMATPFQGMPLANIALNMMNGREVSPVLFLNEIESLVDNGSKVADQQGLVSKEMMGLVISETSKMGGVNLETLSNIYFGVEQMVLKGDIVDANDAKKMIDLMYILNTPKKGMADAARNLYKDESLEEYVKNVALARRYMTVSSLEGSWMPWIKPAEGSKFQKEYANLQKEWEAKHPDMDDQLEQYEEITGAAEEKKNVAKNYSTNVDYDDIKEDAKIAKIDDKVTKGWKAFKALQKKEHARVKAINDAREEGTKKTPAEHYYINQWAASDDNIGYLTGYRMVSEYNKDVQKLKQQLVGDKREDAEIMRKIRERRARFIREYDGDEFDKRVNELRDTLTNPDLKDTDLWR